MSKKTKTTVFFFSFLMALVVGTCFFVQKSIASSVLSAERFQESQFEQSKTPFEETTEYLLDVECKDVLIKQLVAPIDNDKHTLLRMKPFSGMLFRAKVANELVVRYRSYVGSCHSSEMQSRFIYYLFEKILI